MKSRRPKSHRRMWGEDLYLVLPSYQVGDQSASVASSSTADQLDLGWIRDYGAGTGIVLLPSGRSPSPWQIPAEVATTAGMLLLMASFAVPAFAQTANAQNVPIAPKNPLEKRLHAEIVCTCGCRRALDNCGMPNCGGHEAQSAKIRGLMAEGKDHDAIIATFVRDFGGQDILIEPSNEGFNRLAWLFPYAFGGFGALAGAFMVRKWSRRRPASAPETAAATVSTEDAALQARLDRELEDLD